MKATRNLFLALFLVAFSSLSAAPAEARDLKVVSLNTWLLSFLGHHIGRDMKERALVIPHLVAEENPDLIALQEVWPNRDKNELIDEFKKWGYDYSFEVPRNLGLGNGLVIVSRYPIVDTKISPRYHEITQLDEVIAKKGAIYAEIELSPTEHIDFFTTHLGALSYDEKAGTYEKSQRKHQLEQYQELRDWFMKTRKNKHAIIAGDFNGDYRLLKDGKFQGEFDPGYLAFIQETCGDGEDLLNTFLTANKMDASSAPIPTYDFQRNPYAAEGLFSGAPSETEDYIFSCGFESSDASKGQVILSGPIPTNLSELKGRKTPLRASDHFGLSAVFTYDDSPAVTEPDQDERI